MAVRIVSTVLGANPDYTRYLWENKMQKVERYKDSTLLNFTLVPWDTSFVRLGRGSYIKVEYGGSLVDYYWDQVTFPWQEFQQTWQGTRVWYTGYITNEPDLEFIGRDRQTQQPIYGYHYNATSDEYILSLKPLGMLPVFYNTPMGQILKILIERLAPGMFDLSGIDDGPLVAQYYIEPHRKFIDVVQEFCEAAAYTFYAQEHKAYFTRQDTVAGQVIVDGSDAHFTPSRLQIGPSQSPIVNDATVLGSVEPQTYMTEYFVGTGIDAAFPLVGSVFGVDQSILIDEVFDGSSINGSVWDVSDGSGFFSVENGYLNVLGGSGDMSQVNITSAMSIPLDGRLRLTHGEWDILPSNVSSNGNGFIGGLWAGSVDPHGANCIYALHVKGGKIAIFASGSDRDEITVDATKRYVMRTLAEFPQSNRQQQTYSYVDSNGAVQSIGGATRPDSALFATIITEVDPANGKVTKQWNFTHSTPMGVAYARYVPVASQSLHATVTGITVSTPINATLEMATQSSFMNLGFETWGDDRNPTGWAQPFGVRVWKESQWVDEFGGLSCKLDPPGLVYLEQSAVGLVEQGRRYRIVLRAQRNPALTTGTFSVALEGSNNFSTAGIRLAANSINTTWTTYTGELLNAADLLKTLPLDVRLVVKLENGDGPMWVDSILIWSDFEQQIVGPNEVDAMDGLSPVATIVQGNHGSDTRNNYTGQPQYNAGQAQLVFFKDSLTRESNVPPRDQIIRLSYRSAGGAVGRAVSRESINAEAAKWGDDGVRSVVQSDLIPRPRTSEECEMAAAAIVGENAFTHYEGSYTQYSPFLTDPPRAGAVMRFVNLPQAVDLVAEEIHEVVSTIETERYKVYGQPTELFLHHIRFGKPDHIRKLLTGFDTVKGIYQKSVDAVSPKAFDFRTVGTSFAPDVIKPQLLGWDNAYLYMDAGQDLGSNGLFFEVRYTDWSWGVDDARNLVVRSASRYFKVPRTLRGRTFYIKQANRGNYIKWSEDQTKDTYSGYVSKRIGVNPDGDLSEICSFSGTVTTATLGGSVFGVSLRGSPGSLVDVNGYQFTLGGNWQRFTVPGSGMVYVQSLSGGELDTTRWSCSDGLYESAYTKTTDVLYGPVSRFAAGVHVAFPVQLSELGSGMFVELTY